MFGSDADGYSVPVFRMYLIIWAVFFTFHICHWEKYNTGVMYLPWSYDVAMLGGTVLYFFTGLLGYETWKVRLPGGYAAGPLLEVILYVGCYGLSLFMALANMVAAYRAGTHKRDTFPEAMRPMVSYFVAYAICVSWAALSPAGVLDRDARCFFYLSGTLYANMSCRLIVAQMSGTRSELVNRLLYPAGACAALSLSGLLSAGAEMVLVYGLAALVTVFHVHYAVCVVLQLCELLNIDCFSIANAGKGRTVPGGGLGEGNGSADVVLPSGDGDKIRLLSDSDDSDSE